MRRTLRVLLIALVIFGMVAVLPFLLGDSEQRTLNETVRNEMKDKTFVALSDGVTHYTWSGPESGQKVLLIHGFSTPSWVWDHQVPALTEAGLRVLTLDLFGRGLSDRPNAAYGPELYDRQILQLLDALKVTDPIDIVGLSMGGAITMRFTDAHPDRVRRFALIAPAGIGVAPPGAARLLAIPGLGPWIMQAFGDRILFGMMEKMLTVKPELTPQLRERYKEQMQFVGYKHALRSTLIHMPLTNLDDTFARVGKQNKKCALIWGTNDTVVPYEYHDRVMKALPGTTLHTIEGAGHAVNYEEPEKVNPALVALLTD